MPTRLDQRKAELTDLVQKKVKDRLPREKAALAGPFVQQFYANVAPDDILRASADQLYGAAMAVWQLATRRRPGEALVRVLNPRVDQDGWHAAHTVVEIVNDDMPFLVDSVSAELNRHGLTLHLLIHPVIRTRRDGEGRLVELYDKATAPADALAESVMHIEVDQLTSPDQLRALSDGLVHVLSDVRAAVEDFRRMRTRVAATISEGRQHSERLDPVETREALDFLQWMDDEHFIFLGIREYRFGEESGEQTLDIQPGQGLGILRDDDVTVFDGLRNFSALPPEVKAFIRQPRMMMVTKANKLSTVHRPAVLDAVMIKLFDESGREVGERLFVGLFTSTAYNRSARDIPFLRQKVSGTVERAGFDPRGHDGKALVHILETFPRDELFQIAEDELLEISLGILHLQERQRVALFVRRDPFERFVSCLVYVPRDRYDTELRRRIQALIERAYAGKASLANVALTESVHARLHLLVTTTAGKTPAVDVHDLEEQLIETARGWQDRLQQALVEHKGEAIGLTLFRRFGGLLSASYRELYSPDQAVVDIERTELARETGRMTLNLYRPVDAERHELYFKVYQPGPAIALSRVLPVLEDMGLDVIAEHGPFELELSGDAGGLVTIQDFQMATASGRPLEMDQLKGLFEDAFARVWANEAQSDGFNRLVLEAGFGWREVAVFRAYAKYLKQARFDFTQEYIESTLARHADIARLLMTLFRVSHDPALREEIGAKEVDSRRMGLIVQIDHALDKVTNIDEDRILRRMLNVIRATLRTNFFQPAADGQPKSYISFKLDSGSVEDLPLPRPWREIWVYSPRVEAIHLRGGKVARGGIRWSDRKEDFRTEILGLIKAQMVKNAVIVPVGSKGGFVVKLPPPASAGREALMAEVIECYKTMMRGLLDITDNLVAGTLTVPPHVVRLDGDDPYLVVAADKGTATFSDIANGVSRDFGFWLDDAFASGGSAGYDHKKMGITARGAWESVKRHFRELGIDIQTTDFTVVGVGDMSGDVFGNGMLLSRHIKLLGAFDHRHIFIDPNPDPALSFAERERLFALPRSSWADYDRTVLSEGAAIYERSAKTIQLTPQIRALFGFSTDRTTPTELMTTLLRSKVDLLWFGGIGTYIRASDETNTEVGDKANDAIRITGREIKARVLGEGANLGVTQRGRIEAALNGIMLNTDAIDNSAGVDTSDHEVNIKILLRDVMSRGAMTREQRDVLLAEMTDEVASLVLADNYKQTQALTVAQAKAPEMLEDQARFMRAMEKAGKLNRTVEYLPAEDEIAARAQRRLGLTRPELAVLLAYSKIDLYDKLLASELPDDPKMAEDLVQYFPGILQERFPQAIAGHQLRREIICTVATNGMVNRVGPTFVWEMVESSGRSEADVARAYLVVREAFALRRIWKGIEQLDNRVPADVQTTMVLETDRLMRRTVPWLLLNGRHPLDITGEAGVLAPVVESLADGLPDILTVHALTHLGEAAGRLHEKGVPSDLAKRIATLPILAAAPDIAAIASSTGREPTAVAGLFFGIGERLGLDWLRERAATARAETHWDRQAVGAVIDDLWFLQARMAARIAESGDGDSAARIDVWLAGRSGQVERVQGLLGELRSVVTIGIPMLTVATRQLRGLVAG
jgi:glutamate dehydrogenase